MSPPKYKKKMKLQYQSLELSNIKTAENSQIDGTVNTWRISPQTAKLEAFNSADD